MFSGIVEELGLVRSVAGHRIEVGCRIVGIDSDVGASVSVNGVCLTVVERGPEALTFDLSGETIARTALGDLEVGARVNLERAAMLAGRLGGHIVQGHVDGVGRIAAFDRDETGGATCRVEVPAELLRYVVPKGSLTVDGVSLTVAAMHDDGVSIALIPHTLAVTTFGSAQRGDPVHLEVDVIAKYVERLTASRLTTDRGDVP